MNITQIAAAVHRLQGQLSGLAHSARQAEGVAKAVMVLAQKIPNQTPAQISRLTLDLMSVYKGVEAIPGKVVTYQATALQSFTTADEFRKGNPTNVQISTDGPFIQTSYPLVIWRPIGPAGVPGVRATDLGLARPVTVGHLPTQQFGNNFIEISWEIESGGSQRAQQNSRSLPFFSRGDYNNRLPQPYVWRPNDSILFFPTYQRILFGGQVATTVGQLEVTLPGYRIVDQ